MDMKLDGKLPDWAGVIWPKMLCRSGKIPQLSPELIEIFKCPKLPFDTLALLEGAVLTNNSTGEQWRREKGEWVKI